MELSNARRNQEQRNQLTQTLELKKSQLTLDKQTLARTRELFEGGLSPRVELEKAENAVTVRERDIDETEAALRVLSETSDRESDLKTRELEEAESELKLLKAEAGPSRSARRRATSPSWRSRSKSSTRNSTRRISSLRSTASSPPRLSNAS